MENEKNYLLTDRISMTVEETINKAIEAINSAGLQIEVLESRRNKDMLKSFITVKELLIQSKSELSKLLNSVPSSPQPDEASLSAMEWLTNHGWKENTKKIFDRNTLISTLNQFHRINSKEVEEKEKEIVKIGNEALVLDMDLKTAYEGQRILREKLEEARILLSEVALFARTNNDLRPDDNIQSNIIAFLSTLSENPGKGEENIGKVGQVDNEFVRGVKQAMSLAVNVCNCEPIIRDQVFQHLNIKEGGRI